MKLKWQHTEIVVQLNETNDNDDVVDDDDVDDERVIE